MRLAKENIQKIKETDGLVIPGEAVFLLPEKVLQFGTGVLLRALPDYFIDEANRQGIFNGRVAVVKSTSAGGADAFETQDGLYTLCIRGIENGKEVKKDIIHSAISRVLPAKESWKEILDIAASKELEVIISNTTEVGITYVEEKISDSAPASFPGKLLACLYHRFNTLGSAHGSGLVIVPTELIVDNASKLKDILIKLAHFNQLSPAFLEWLEKENDFCNSLVDRIVPGKLKPAIQKEEEERLGYTDELMILSECFSLWAIETKTTRARKKLSFSEAHPSVVLADDIGKFRELKLRLLNGTHTFACGPALLGQWRTVGDAMNDTNFLSFISQLALDEIAVALPDERITQEEAREFGQSVLDRFRNPFLEHLWTSISVQFSSKMKMRNIPLILQYEKKEGRPPSLMAMGMAAFLLYMRTAKEPPVQDDNANWLLDKWKDKTTANGIEEILSDSGFWGAGLSQSFIVQVKEYAERIEKVGMKTVIEQNVMMNTGS